MPVRQVRHGAAVALREVLRSHAACAGVVAPCADETSGWASAGSAGKRPLAVPLDAQVAAEAASANAAWLEDCVILLMCVLALDRFGDYGSDQVRLARMPLCVLDSRMAVLIAAKHLMNVAATS